MLVVLIVVLVGVVGYFVLTQKPEMPQNQPTPISEAKITSPSGDEKWIIGKKNTIRWNPLSDEAKEVGLSLVGVGDGLKGSYPLTIESLGQYLDSKSTSFVWDTKETYPVHHVTTVLPGTYQIRLSFTSREGYSASVTSESFKLINP